MNSPPDEVYAEVRDTDPDTLDSGELDADLRRLAEIRAWCDARQVRATRRQRQLAAEGRAAGPRSSLTNHGRRVTVDDCRIHHVRPWERGGRTDLADLAPVCEPHHHLIHEGGWSLTMTADRIATWIRPDGEVYWCGSVTDRLTTRVG